jgi:hypothetical protein
MSTTTRPPDRTIVHLAVCGAGGFRNIESWLSLLPCCNFLLVREERFASMKASL